MPVTVAIFRQDYAEFADVTRFPNAQITYWLNFAQLMLSVARFGAPSPYTLTAVAPDPAALGSGYAAADTITLAGGTFSTAASLLVKSVFSNGKIGSLGILGPGLYSSPAPTPTAQQVTSGEGSGALFAATFTASAPSQYDVATELFVAHNVSLERRALDEAAAGAQPGVTTGPVGGKSVGGVNVSYDVGSGVDPKDTHFNLTIYGVRLIRLISLFGMGPVTVFGRPFPPGPNNGPGWPGPVVDQGGGWGAWNS